MSAPPASLPVEIAELMWLTTVQYYQATGTDGYGQNTYASPVTVDCWVEPHGYQGVEAFRPTLGQETLTADLEPVIDLYFDGSNTYAQMFTMDDKFTPAGVVASTLTMKPREIATMYGPNFDNLNSWIVIVHL